ncbi:MAG: CHASE sensor domain-containing protein [Methylococcales bacterium]|nr:CHASE sensor domain-containing protein [Methylococcales bacterium]
MGNRSTAALLFHDQKLAEENLAVINSLPEVQAGCIYDAEGKLFAALLKNEATEWMCPVAVEGWTTKFTDTKLCVVQAIIDNAEKQGTVYIHADFEAAYWRKIQFVGILFLVLMGVSILTFFLSAPLLKLISAPISKLVNAAKAISASHDYSLRAIKVNEDELGVLVDAFNDLIETVQTQNLAVLEAKNRYFLLYDDNPSMMISINALGNILSVNQTCADQLGLDSEDFKNHTIFDFIYTSDIPTMSAFIEQCLLNPTRVHKQEFRQISSQGQIA